MLNYMIFITSASIFIQDVINICQSLIPSVSQHSYYSFSRVFKAAYKCSFCIENYPQLKMIVYNSELRRNVGIVMAYL